MLLKPFKYDGTGFIVDFDFFLNKLNAHLNDEKFKNCLNDDIFITIFIQCIEGEAARWFFNYMKRTQPLTKQNIIADFTKKFRVYKGPYHWQTFSLLGLKYKSSLKPQAYVDEWNEQFDTIDPDLFNEELALSIFCYSIPIAITEKIIDQEITELWEAQHFFVVERTRHIKLVERQKSSLKRANYKAKNGLQSTQKNKNAVGVRCFNCGWIGHYAKNCSF